MSKLVQVMRFLPDYRCHLVTEVPKELAEEELVVPKMTDSMSNLWKTLTHKFSRSQDKHN